MLRWLTVLGALAVVGVAAADERPFGPAPRVARVRIEKDSLILPTETKVDRETFRDVEVIVDGRKETRKVKVLISEMVLMEQARPVAGLKVYDLAGKEVDLATARRR